MVMDQGNFHIMDNDLNFTIIWELAHFLKSTALHLNQNVDFISRRSLLTCTNSESWQNFRSIAVLHVFIVSL